MKYFCFELKPFASIDETWDVLTKAGFQLLYANEEVGKEKQVFGYPPLTLQMATLLDQFDQIKDFHLQVFDEINWHEQWGASKEDKFISIDLKEYSQGQENQFRMKPGPGFGDLSHPTTRLVLKLMAPLVRGKFVIDLGCGSGVLSFAAAKLGAERVCGIEIDPEALIHANQNLELNEELKEKIFFRFPSEAIEISDEVPLVLVMNMIYQEQEEAWKSLPILHKKPLICVTSGILSHKAQEKIYLDRCKAWGWTLTEKCQEDNWCGYVFE